MIKISTVSVAGRLPRENLDPVEEDHDMNLPFVSLAPAWSSLRLLRLSSLAVCLLWASPARPQEQDTTAPTPATVEEAAKVLDLRTLPLLEAAQAPDRRRMAEIFYEGKADVRHAYEFQKHALTVKGWREAPGSNISADSASGTFVKDGFRTSVSVFPADAKAGTVKVLIAQSGNVDVSNLPVPAGCKPVYVGPASAIYKTEADRDATARACRDLLLAQGWQPYGAAGNSLVFKQNAVQLNAMIASSPAQAGMTLIQYSTKLLSADLPAPADAVRVQYADTTTTLSFDVKATPKALVDEYRGTLGKAGWKPTTEHTIKDRDHEMLIFRNPARDMVTLKFAPFENMLRGTLEHLSAAESDALDRRAQVAVSLKTARGAMEKAKSKPTVAIPLPADAADVKEKNGNLEFKVPGGRSKPVVEDVRAALRQDGWKEELATLEEVAGALSVSKQGSGSLTINYTDTGLEPGEISITAIGVDAIPIKGGERPKAERQ
jgi:hypothetical protein